MAEGERAEQVGIIRRADGSFLLRSGLGTVGRPTSKVTKVIVRGPLAPFSAAFRSRLAEAGYTPLTIVSELRQVAQLSRWMFPPMWRWQI